MANPFATAGTQTDPFRNAGKQWTPPAAPKVAPKAAAPPTKVVQVRAHTRSVPVKKAAPAPQPKPVAPVASVRPAETSTVQRLTPNFKGEPVAGITMGHWRPDGSFVKGGQPYYTDANTLHHFAGPAGQQSTAWNAATAAQAHRMQIAQYGTPGYIARSLVPGGLDQSGTTSIAKAITRGVEAGSTVLPGGGVGELASVFGFGLKALRGIRAGRDIAEAAPVVKGVAEAAPKLVHEPPVPAPHTTEPAATLRAALPGAKIIRGKQEAGYSVERGARAAAARIHLENPNLPPAERVRLAKGELPGELPKINFQGFNELNHESLQALQTHILDHPHLLPFQKIRASDALVSALAGKVPTRSEITLLEHVFGKDTADGLSGIARHPFREKLLSALNIPRSLMSSFDLSAPFRQGLMVATRHPTIFAHNFGSMVKAFGSEKVYQGILDEIHARPSYPLMVGAKLPLTELGHAVGPREERFASDYAEKLTGGKWGPVRMSGRAYTGFLDKTRADVFDHLIQRAQAQGIDVQDEKFLKSLGKYIGSATGRGDLGAFQEAGKYLNAVMFSPRLLASRLNFLNPLYYRRLHPFARKEALRSAIQLAGTLSTLAGLASQVPGVKVQTDPRNPDWGKIRIGNTRLDMAGGFQQPLRLLAQLATGVAISSTTGKKLNLTAGGFGKPTRLDIAQRFFMGKEAPWASLLTDWLRNQTQIGQKFSWKSEAAQRLTPLLGQDAYDLYRERHGGMNGLMAALAGYGVGAFGLGLQTYEPKKPTTAGPRARYTGQQRSTGGRQRYTGPSGRSTGRTRYLGP